MIAVVHMFEATNGKPLGDGKPWAHKVGLHIPFLSSLCFLKFNLTFMDLVANILALDL